VNEEHRDDDTRVRVVTRARSVDATVPNHGRAQQFVLDDDSFDFVFCRQGLQFVPDRTAAVSLPTSWRAPNVRGDLVTVRR